MCCEETHKKECFGRAPNGFGNDSLTLKTIFTTQTIVVDLKIIIVIVHSE
jgi:hypothetical protein